MNKLLIIFYARPSKTVWGGHLKDYLEGRKKVSQATAGGTKLKSATALEKIHHPAIQMFVSFNKDYNHKNSSINCRLCVGNPSEKNIYETRAYNILKLEGFGSNEIENSEPMPLPRIFTRARQIIARKICETREIKTSLHVAQAEKETQISQLMFPYSKLIRSSQGEFNSIWDKYANNASQILKELLPTNVLKELVYYGFFISHQKYRVANNIENFVKSFVIGYIRFILQAIDRLDIYGPISLSTGSIAEYLKEKGLIDRANNIFKCNSSPLLFARSTGPISRALAKRINPLGAFAIKRLFNWKVFSDTLVKNLILIDSVIIYLVMKYQLLNTALLSKAISQIPPQPENLTDTDYRIFEAYKCLECFPNTAQEAITLKADKSADPRTLFSVMHKTRVETDPVSGKIIKEERNFDFIFTLNFTNKLYYLDVEHIYKYQKTYCFTPIFSDPIHMCFYLLLEGGLDGFFGTAFKGDLITPLATPDFREKFKTNVLDKFKNIYDKIENAVAYIDSHLLNKGFHDISSNNPLFKREMGRIARSANFISSYVPTRVSSTLYNFTPSSVSDYIWSQDGNLSLIDTFVSNVGEGTTAKLSLKQFFANYIFKIKDPSSQQDNATTLISSEFFKQSILKDGKHNETHLREQPLMPVFIILRYLHDPNVKKSPNIIDLYVLFNFLLHLCIQILAAPKRFSYEIDLKKTTSHSHKALLKIIECTYLSICFIQAATEQTPSRSLPSTLKIPKKGESLSAKRISLLYYTLEEVKLKKIVPCGRLNGFQKRLISDSSGWRFDSQNNLILPNSIHFRRLLYYFKATLKENFINEFFTNVKVLLQEKEVFNNHIIRYRESQEEFKKKVMDELTKDNESYIRKMARGLYSQIIR